MKRQFFSTDNGWTGFVLRLTAALVMFPHGAQKLLGWFGGYGFTGTMGFFTETVGLPWFIGFLVIIIEFFGSFALLAGIGSRLVAGLFTVLVLGIVFTSHIHNGFFMNWAGNITGEGFEYFLLFLGILITLQFTGSGRLSVDRQLYKKMMD